MANVNTGRRTAKQDAEALKELEQTAEASGDTIVEEDGAKYIVTKSFGFTIKTRIA